MILRQAQDKENMKNFGFTLIELMVVIGVVGIIMTFSTVNLLSLRNKSSLNSTVTQLVADLKQQQIKSMIGDTENLPPPYIYGIHILKNSYVLFHGTSYFASPDNFTVNLEQDLSFSANQDIIFKKGCGELWIGPPASLLCGEDSTQTSVTIKNKNSNEQKQITINQFGIIKSVN